MFEEPDAKRVRRSDLVHDSDNSSRHASPSDSSPPPPKATSANDAFHFDFDFVDHSHENPTRTTAASIEREENRQEPGEEGFEFRLFSSSAVVPRPINSGDAEPNRNDSAPVVPHSGFHRINVRSPTPMAGSGDGAFVVPCRSQAYYFTGDAGTDKKKGYARAAVSGKEVMQTSQRTRWPGTALPWRVIHLPSTDNPNDPSSSQPQPMIVTITPSRRPRTRPGKKTRIATRQKLAATLLKAETDKEKRTRRNREKKVKKKGREKLKKLEARTTASPGAGVDANDARGDAE